MWDNRASKAESEGTDYKCKTDGCDGIIWPPREQGAVSTAKPAGTKDDRRVRSAVEDVGRPGQQAQPACTRLQVP